MELNQNTPTTFETILAIFKTIPSYQRDFVWEQDDVLDFINSLWDASEENRSSYFCGSMVLFKNDEDIYEIVDGQQRTTVIYTLIANLIKNIPDEKRREKLRDKHIFYEDNDDIKKYRFTHKIPEVRNFFIEVGEGNAFRPNESDNSQILNTLHDCNEVINSFIREKVPNDPVLIRSFLNFIIEKAFVIHYLASDMADALLTYQRLNTGGKQLGHLEIVKGMLYASVEKQKDDWEIFEGDWSKFWSELIQLRKIGGTTKDRAKEVIKQDKFLTYFFLTNYPEIVNDFCKVIDGFPPESKLSDLLQSQDVRDKLYINPRKFLKDLDRCIKSIINMRTGNHHNPIIMEKYIDIAMLSQSQTQPLMFMLSIADSEYLQSKLLEDVYKLIFIFTTSLTGSGTTSGVWKYLSKRCRELKDNNLKEPEILDTLKQEFKLTITKYFETNFVEYLRRQDIFSDNSKLKKTLRNLEVFMRRKSGIDNKYNYSDWYGGIVDVDHISPKNSDLPPEILNSIGNAALIDRTTNRGLKDSEFNSTKKQDAYKKQEYFHSRALVLNESNEQGKNKIAIELIKQRHEMTENDIKERSAEIESIFRNYLTN